MATELKISSEEWRQLRQHLFQSDVEQAAIVFADFEENGDGLLMTSREIELLDSQDFEIQSAFHISLTDECRGRLIKTAWDRRLIMLEVHSHTGTFAFAEFSLTDIDGLAEFVPHVRWRLRGVPYAAIVMAGDEFDALVWCRENVGPIALDAVHVGSAQLQPTMATLNRLRVPDGG